jgi:hypothetical protein
VDHDEIGEITMPLYKAFRAGAAQFAGTVAADGLLQFPPVNDPGKYAPVISQIAYYQPIPPAAGTQGFAIFVELAGVNPTDAILIRFWSATNLLTNWDYPCKRKVPEDLTSGGFMAFRFVTTTKTVDATLYVEWEIEPVGAFA